MTAFELERFTAAHTEAKLGTRQLVHLDRSNASFVRIAEALDANRHPFALVDPELERHQ